MADFYMKEITKAQFPNIIKEFNKGQRNEVDKIYSADYIKGQFPVILGYFLTKEAAILAIKSYAANKLHTKSINIKEY